MKISECNYCGMLAITDRDVCSSCATLISPETEAAAQSAAQPEIHAQAEMNPFQQATPAPMPAYTAANNQYVPQQTFQNAGGFANSHQPRQPVMDARCVRCKTFVPRGQSQCFDCANRKSSPLKYVFVLALFGIIGFFAFDYVYEQVSPHGIFRKYAKTTGADNSLIFENFVLEGEAYLSADYAPGVNKGALLESQHMMQTFSFKMIFKKPNIASLEFLRDGSAGSSTAYKQVFDGTRGWIYTNLPNQPVGYRDTDDGFASRNMGLGMDEYDSLEFTNEAIEQQFGKNNIKALTDIKEVEAADIKKPSGEKVIVLGKQKHNGKIESSLLVFDQQTGLLLGIIKNDMMNNIPITTIIYLNKYAKFPVTRKGWFGNEERQILVPTKMSFVAKPGDSGQISAMPVIMIELNVKTVKPDAVIENSYFQKQ